jgi:hypothetical protein
VFNAVAKKKNIVSIKKKASSFSGNKVDVKVVSVKSKGAVSAKKKETKELPMFKRILGDEFLAISAIILFASFIKLGLGFVGIALTLFIIATFSFIAGISVKSHIKKKC